MLEMVIYGVSFDMVGKQPIVLLKTLAGNRFLPIWIGHPEAAAILMRLQEHDRLLADHVKAHSIDHHLLQRGAPDWGSRSLEMRSNG